VCAAVMQSSSFAQDQPRPAKVEGIVQNDKGDPLAGVGVSMGRPDGTVIRTVTDATGAFTLDDTPTGRNYVGFVRDGYISRRLYYSISPGDTVRQSVVKLSSTGVLSGRLFDSAGKPIPDILIIPIRSILAADGYREFIAHAGAKTNDRGEFRVLDLPPGPYWLNIASPLSPQTTRQLPMPGLEIAEERRIPPFLYPDATQISEAAVVVVKAGEEVRLRDMVHPGRRFGSIRIELSNPGPEPREVNLGFASVSRWVNSSTSEVFITNTQAISDPRGQPLVFNLEPGKSIVRTFWPNLAGQYEAILWNAGSRVEISRARMDFSGADLHVPLSLARNDASLTFQARLTDTDGLVPARGIRLNLSSPAVSYMANRGNPLGGATDANGSLTLPLPAGRYELYRAVGLPADSYVERVEQSGRNALTEGILAGPQAAPVEVRLRKGPASVRGVVKNTDGSLLQDAFVTVVPATPLSASTFVNLRPSARTTQDGAFDLPGLAPGTYSVYAWAYEEYPSSSVESGDYLNPEFLRRFQQRAVAIELRERSTSVIEIVVPRPTN
jgi:hypothetical protein